MGLAFSKQNAGGGEGRGEEGRWRANGKDDMGRCVWSICEVGILAERFSFHLPLEQYGGEFGESDVQWKACRLLLVKRTPLVHRKHVCNSQSPCNC